MKSKDIPIDKKDGGDRLAGLSPAVSGPPLGPTVIPFRKADTSAASGFAAGGDPPSPPASFEPLGHAVSAVVMRIRNSRLRIQAMVPAEGGDAGTIDDGSGGR